ncbi:sigma-w pathway protein ysdB [Paenalkalicoccus suaedae]|uniref:Sigma-w pathway protein ysdB n=1 Tax=Paenalkalicoccus suaedae TaxID=2592382 RepID=A0A859FGR6_9BACI|nr:sigma-w pathway protein ysdB [Paenalkalicoccus suaedae]QKS72008.1 sigma-w pathway protein ysdB [Paenalkalicoccus suaedae]
MTVLLFRLFLLIAVGIIVFSIGKYVLDPKRKLERAKQRGDFYLLDDVDQVRKNVLFTVHGALFYGEKFLGPSEDSFEVVRIAVHTDDIDQLQGMQAQDFVFLEKELTVRYPKAEIEWRSPIKEVRKRLKT